MRSVLHMPKLHFCWRGNNIPHNLCNSTKTFSKRCSTTCHFSKYQNETTKDISVDRKNVILKRNTHLKFSNSLPLPGLCSPSLLNAVGHFQVTSPGSRMYQTLRSEKFSLENPAVQKHLKKTLEEYDELTTKLLEPDGVSDNERMGLGKIHWKLTPLAESLKEYETKKVELTELQKMIESLDSSDGEMLELTKEEIARLIEKMEHLEDQILHLMVPPERIDDSDIILEVQAGVGGQEAMLFTRDIFTMYENYAVWRGWKFEILDCEQTELGGIRRASASIHGLDVFKYLKFEGGVHRVQRVPVTEKTGRIHTSTMTVAILPQPHEIDIHLNPSDLKIDTFRASGKGGQHVNKTESAVRLTHIPTGVVAECQADRSQIKNRDTALKILKSRLYQKELEKQSNQLQSKRKLQVGSRSRSEKIRTYNYNQDRITDHRVKATSHNLEEFLKGKEMFHDMVETLMEESRIEILEEIVDEN